MTATTTDSAPWTAQRVQRALYSHFVAQGYHPLVEVTIDVPRAQQGDGLALPRPAQGDAWTRRIDMLLIRRARRRGIGHIERLAIEIKTARGDLLADLRDPAKQAPWRDLAHRHAYAFPAGLARTEEIPADSGVLTIAPHSRLGHDAVSWARRATYTKAPDPLPTRLIIALAARASAAEARIRGLSASTGQLGDDPASLRAKVEELRNQVDRLTRERDRHQDAAITWRAAFAACEASGGVPCDDCGNPIKPIFRLNQVGEWRHVDRAHAEPCEKIRTVRAASRWAGRYIPPIAPRDES